MQIRSLFAVALLMLPALMTQAQQSADLSAHVFFRHFIGKWEAEGDLTAADGHIVKVKEQWTGKSTEEGGFVINGTRQIDETQQTFRWSITRNAATDNFAGVLVTDGNEAEALRFEVNVSEVNLTADLKASIGTNGSVTLHDAFTTDDKSTMESKVVLTGDSGETNLSGTLTHKRVVMP